MNNAQLSSVQLTNVAIHLRDNGFYEMANTKLAQEYVERLRDGFPGLALVSGVGDLGIRDMLYVPSARLQVIGIVENQILQLEDALDANRKALDQLKHETKAPTTG